MVSILCVVCKIIIKCLTVNSILFIVQSPPATNKLKGRICLLKKKNSNISGQGCVYEDVCGGTRFKLCL